MEIEKLLKIMVDKPVSDLFITVDMPPAMEINGQLTPLSSTPISAGMVRRLVFATLTSQQQDGFVKKK